MANNTSRIENMEHNNMEIIWVEVKAGQNKLCIGTYYGHQENTPTEDIDREMNELRTTNQQTESRGGIILTGDFNANIDQPSCKHPTSRNCKYLEELLKACNFIVYILNVFFPCYISSRCIPRNLIDVSVWFFPTCNIFLPSICICRFLLLYLCLGGPNIIFLVLSMIRNSLFTSSQSFSILTAEFAF